MFDLLRNNIAFGTDEVVAAAAAATSAEPAKVTEPAKVEEKATENILFGKTTEGEKTPEGEKKPDAAAEWKEYAPDATKTAEENARLKAEHDRTKPADDKAKDDDPLNQVPADGKYVIALPDGVELDSALLEKAAPVMKELNLTNGQATKLAGVIADVRKAEFDALNERNQKVIQDWQKSIKTDKDFGGDKLDVSLKTAERALATYGDDELRSDLTELGLGNYPGLFRLLVRVGNENSDDKPVTSETPAASKKSPEEAMYGATTPTTRG
ncbi:hypothetical protein [Pararhizobium qamdonense]|uniref:hypothetical protein n=1 Tax=Pararhizobium qamdonense TaxID=3031126 RepID=UPI0023E2CF1B|nr:hypothetical protein [Pararhizobium qamdonense]